MILDLNGSTKKLQFCCQIPTSFFLLDEKKQFHKGHLIFLQMNKFIAVVAKWDNDKLASKYKSLDKIFIKIILASSTA
jgi:hypothetical protein